MPLVSLVINFCLFATSQHSQLIEFISKGAQLLLWFCALHWNRPTQKQERMRNLPRDQKLCMQLRQSKGANVQASTACSSALQATIGMQKSTLVWVGNTSRTGQTEPWLQSQDRPQHNIASVASEHYQVLNFPAHHTATASTLYSATKTVGLTAGFQSTLWVPQAAWRWVVTLSFFLEKPPQQMTFST